MGAFDFPIIIDKDNDYLDSYKRRVSDYIDILIKLKSLPHLSGCIAYIDNAINEVKKMRARIIRCFNSQFNGKSSVAINSIKSLFVKYQSIFVENLLSSRAFLGRWYLEQKQIDELYLYKGRVDAPFKTFSYRDMLHIPLSLRKVVQTRRYSMPGIPCIYLAQNSYVVWKEMKMPSFDTLSLSAFKITNRDLKIIDLTYPFEEVFEILNDSNLFTKSYNTKHLQKVIFRNIQIFPLIAAVSVKCNEECRKFQSEYVIPQLLMFCLNKDIVGIAYHSNEINTSNHMFASNLAIPIIDFDEKSDFGEIRHQIEITDPINFDYFNKAINNSISLSSGTSCAKGLHAGVPFSSIRRPLSTFNTIIFQWKGASYDGLMPYCESPFYKFDDYILYLKGFNLIP